MLWPYIIDELDTLLTLIPQDSSFLLILIFTWCSYFNSSDVLQFRSLKLLCESQGGQLWIFVLHQNYWSTLLRVS